MDYKSKSLYQKLNELTLKIKDRLKNTPDFKRYNIQEYKKVLIGRGSLSNNEPVGAQFDFVAYSKPGFQWSNQKSKDEVLLAANIISKNSVRSLDQDIEKELFKFHSIHALRKLLIVVNTVDASNNESLISHLLKNYEVFLNFPPYLTTEVNLEKCPLCGTTPSRIELWFYNEETDELLPVAEHLDDGMYFNL